MTTSYELTVKYKDEIIYKQISHKKIDPTKVQFSVKYIERPDINEQIK